MKSLDELLAELSEALQPVLAETLAEIEED